MPIEFVDSFSQYADAPSLMALKWTDLANVVIAPEGGRRGGGAMVLTGSARARKAFTPSAGVVVGFALNANLAQGTTIMRLLGGSGVQASLRMGAGGALQVVRGDPATVTDESLLVTGAAAVPANNWRYVEVQVVLGGAQSGVGVHVTTETVPRSAASKYGTPGANAQGSDVGYCEAVEFVAGTICDLYIATVEPLLVDEHYLGDSRVDFQLPITDGFHQSLTPSVPGPHFQIADNNPPTADYLRGTAVGNKDTYKVAPIPSLTGTIKAVQFCTYASKSSSDEGTIRHRMRGESGSEGTSVNRALEESGSIAMTIHDQAINGSGPWSEGAINNSEFGVEVTK